MSLNHLETQRNVVYEALGDHAWKIVLQTMLASFLLNNTCAKLGIKHPFQRLTDNIYIMYFWPEAQEALREFRYKGKILVFKELTF